MNWPIRVGGEYKSKTVSGITKRVTSIHEGRVYFDRYYDGDPFKSEHHSDCSISVFCQMQSPEDQSPIPALVEALRDLTERCKWDDHIVAALASTNVIANAEEALAKAGAAHEAEEVTA